MVFFRWIFGLPVAAAITLGLFAMMAGLIQNPLTEWSDPTPYPEIDIKMEPDPVEPDGLPPKPDPLPEAPPIEIDYPAPSEAPGPRIVQPDPGAAAGTDFKGAGVIGAPVIKHAPLYPESCRSRNAEGRVIVQFDVTPEGAVVNPVIVETADRCFNRTVISTVSKWKYPPAAKGGRPAMRYGVVEVFQFNLT